MQTQNTVRLCVYKYFHRKLKKNCRLVSMQYIRDSKQEPPEYKPRYLLFID